MENIEPIPFDSSSAMVACTRNRTRSDTLIGEELLELLKKADHEDAIDYKKEFVAVYEEANEAHRLLFREKGKMAKVDSIIMVSLARARIQCENGHNLSLEAFGKAREQVRAMQSALSNNRASIREQEERYLRLLYKMYRYKERICMT